MNSRDQYKLAVFTFDHTICKRPTFFRFKNHVVDYDQSRKRDHSLNFKFNQADYEHGKKDALDNVKSGFSSWFVNDENHISAIATFHCYPDYIAGHLAHILGKELTRVDSSSRIPYEDTLIAEYRVEGHSRSILISYVNPMADRHSALITLGSKTKQLLQLRYAMLNRDWITEDEPVHLYEGICSEAACEDRFCGHPKDEYVPKYSQLALERNLNTQARYAITVHRVHEGKEFDAHFTPDERESYFAKKRIEVGSVESNIASSSIASSNNVIPASQQISSSTSSWRSGAMLAGLGIFASAVLFGISKVIEKTDQVKPGW